MKSLNRIIFSLSILATISAQAQPDFTNIQKFGTRMGTRFSGLRQSLTAKAETLASRTRSGLGTAASTISTTVSNTRKNIAHQTGVMSGKISDLAISSRDGATSFWSNSSHREKALAAIAVIAVVASYFGIKHALKKRKQVRCASCE